MCKEPHATVVNMVINVLDIGKEDMNNMCYIRGKWIPFDYFVVNHTYKLKGFEIDEYTHFLILMNYKEFYESLVVG